MVARTITTKWLRIQKSLRAQIRKKCGVCRAEEKEGDLGINSWFVFCAVCESEFLLPDALRQVSVPIIGQGNGPAQDKHLCGDSNENDEDEMFEVPVVCLLAYRGRLRDLILSAKAANHYQANQYLQALFAKLVQRFLSYQTEDITAIYVAPQSLWGRIRQKIHLAALLAEAIARQHQIKCTPLRGGRPLRWRKQSQKHDRERHFKETSFALPPGPISFCVDDILTSGETMALIMQQLNQDSRNKGQLMGLCLARA
jgi:predicted amidophosphoribosyltransferase